MPAAALTFSPADVERLNLLSAPSTPLAPGGLLHLVYEKGVGPLSDNAVLEWLTTTSYYPLGAQLVKEGDAVGITLKIRPSPTARTLEAAFADKRDDAPAFAQANLTLRYVLRATRPEELANVVKGAAGTDEINDGVGAVLSRAASVIESKVGATGKWLVVGLIAVAIIVLVVKYGKGRG